MVQVDVSREDTSSKSVHSPNYFFLSKHLSYSAHRDYSQTLVNVMVNANANVNFGKYLFVKNYNDFWTLSRRTLKDHIHYDIFEGFVELIGDELGFRGISSNDSDAVFSPMSYLFDVCVQEFDEIRSNRELSIGKYSKGKVYHLLFVQYKGNDVLPFEHRKNNNTIVDYRWVNYSEAIELLEANKNLFGRNMSKGSSKFHIEFFKMIHKLYLDQNRTREDLKRYKNQI